ncbi:MAG: hypothetical protein H0X24_04320 [Ktedonobacterales bacterium]|nr:hypothetical protein [Ktedonobacterales bacterium]
MATGQEPLQPLIGDGFIRVGRIGRGRRVGGGQHLGIFAGQGGFANGYGDGNIFN